ncbi:uncharacterized protein SCHCODRAFT_02633528 [Schizophyllum commune H4-8]|nr:uncharacterized protein SCHCODRAFT_02633528 [Schizophyllum commune H4-8]KAI5889093.1 hypothetical protein SCHCODRAFT_02633528 [Schizophyllum commune H4-8]
MSHATPCATCTLCTSSFPFPDKWLLFPNCGHAFCESCAQTQGDRCPTCRAASFGRPLLRIRGAQIDELGDMRKKLSDTRKQLSGTRMVLEDTRKELVATRKELAAEHAKWDRLKGVLVEYGALEGVMGAVQMKIEEIKADMRARDEQVRRLRECVEGLWKGGVWEEEEEIGRVDGTALAAVWEMKNKIARYIDGWGDAVNEWGARIIFEGKVHSKVDFFALWHWFLVLFPWVLVMLLCWSWTLPSVSAEQLYIPG